MRTAKQTQLIGDTELGRGGEWYFSSPTSPHRSPVCKLMKCNVREILIVRHFIPQFPLRSKLLLLKWQKIIGTREDIF